MTAIIYSKYNCPQCDTAKQILRNHDIRFEERKIGDGWTKEELLEAVPTAKSVPQIFFGEEYVGGLKELQTKLGK
jgi:glutaredoxin 3